MPYEFVEAPTGRYELIDDKPASVRAGETLKDIPRQFGLTARYGIEGLANVAQIGTEPIRYLTDRLTGATGRSRPIGKVASEFSDWIGLPTPQGANERVIGDAARMVAGAGGLGMAGRAAQGVGGKAGAAGEFFASNPGMQGASAAGAGLAGGSVREAGGGPWEQAGAALLGGVAAPIGVQGAQSIGRSAVNFGRKTLDALAPGAITSTPVDQQISLVLQRQGIDWSTIPERIKQPMRVEVQKALDTGGELNPDALRRLLDFRTVGATPTRGMLTQDPVQITREMNLAKTGANSTDIGLQRLPNLQSQNTGQLLRTLDNAGARNAPDNFATGESVLGALRSNAATSRARIDELYSAARDTSGRSAQLDSNAFANRAGQLLDEANLGSFLTPDIRNKLNNIASGKPGFEFTVDAAEQLKTSIAAIQRGSTNGNERRALGLVRQAIDDAPLRPAESVNPGNLPAVPGTVTPSPSVMGAESIAAFNRARQANRAFMNRVERTPALAAAMDDAQPDRFVQQFITGQGATVRDVDALRRAVAGDPQALQAVQNNIVSHLRSAATTATDDINKFSPAAYNKALNNIGDRKLASFFSPEQIQELRAVGRVGTLMKAQPEGTAVNNSNSGALLIGRAMSALDAISGKLPLGMDTMINGTLRGFQQGSALNVPRGLLQTPESVPMSMRLGAPALYGGLLAAQPTN